MARPGKPRIGSPNRARSLGLAAP